MLLHMVSQLLMMEAGFMLLPLITCLVYNESDWSTFAITSAVTFAVGYGLWKIPTDSTRLARREGYLLVASIWLAFCVFGMLPFLLCSHNIDISSAFFESVSAFTTTGASSITHGCDVLSHGILIWQAILQWLGGMGIIVFTLAIVPAFNTTSGVRMFNAEVTGITHDKLQPRISQTAMSLWGVYMVLTLILIGLLLLGPMDLFESICHAFGTVSTGGFTTNNDGIAAYNSDYVLVVTTIFMFLGGLNFAMIFRAILMKWRPVKADQTIKVYIGVIFLFTVFFALSNAFGGNINSWRDVTIIPLFQVVSTITSTGYIAPGFTIYEPFVLALTFLMMFSGGCAGSTSGGAKIDRLIYLNSYLGNELRRCIHPNAILPVRVNGTVVNHDLVTKTISFLCLYILVTIGGGIVLSLLGLPVVDSFFASLSCICNTGIGASVTGYGEDFTAIPNAAKWVLSFLMLVGRLEIYTVLVLFTKAFWRR